MLKIGIVAPRLSGTGGTETVIQKVISQNDNDYRLFVLNDENNKDWLKKVRIPTKKISTSSNNNNILKLLRLWQFVFFHNFDAVIVLDTKLIYYLNIIKKIFFMKYKIISWIHYSIFDEQLVNTELLAIADYHFAISKGIKRQMIRLGIPESKIDIIYNPIEKNKKDIDTNSERLVYIGRIQFKGQKNLKELFDALAIAKKWSFLDVYGSGTDMELCKKYVKKLGIGEKIIWHGWISNPWSEIDSGKALVLSSKYEGFPMVLLESISRGLPCISANCPTGPEDIINDSNGLIYDMGNVVDLASCIDGIEIDCNNIKETIDAFYSKQYFKRFQFFLNKRLISR